jgi:hypothetical protein
VIKFFRDGEVDPKASGVWDTQSVLATADSSVQPSNSLPAQASAGLPSNAQATPQTTPMPLPSPAATPAAPTFQSFDSWQKSR